MDRKALIGIILIVIIGGAMAGYYFFQGEKDTSSVDAERTSEQSLQSTEPNDSTTPAAVEEATLAAVGSYQGSGIATRTVSGKYNHSVTATLGDPAAGKFYEGWIVGPEGFISTGKLTKEAENSWSLAFTSDDNFSAYNKVVITEETEADGLDNKPEAHVLEGQF